MESCKGRERIFFNNCCLKTHSEAATKPCCNNLKNTRAEGEPVPQPNSYSAVLRSSLPVLAHRASKTRKLNSLQMQGSLGKKTKTYRYQHRGQDGSNLAPRYAAKLTLKGQQACNTTRVQHKSICLSFIAQCLLMSRLGRHW